ncbi:MAG TPA: XcyI family restriction endonuclease [Pirellulales bacterium]|nr:XcyI family restriction endonuclease [Pirellulales bacterium]
MDIKKFHDELLASDEFAQYSLRATFFVRRIRGLRLWEAIQEVSKLVRVENGFDWSNPRSLGIEAHAWERAQEKQIHPLLVFCHPRILSQQPALLRYYRTVALISQKGLGALVGGNVAAIEAGWSQRLSVESISKIVITLNSIISAMLKGAADIDARDLPGYQFASAGATIQGSWNNAVGAAGEEAIRTILIQHLRGELEQVAWRDSTASDYTPEMHTELIDRVADVRILRLKGGYHLCFASEPDVSLRDPRGLPLLSVEVKAGADPAGSLERLGAAMKSFENDRNLNPRVKTVYVVRALTPELQRRISHSKPFDYTFSLSDLLVSDRTQKTFANLVVRAMLKNKN